MPFDASKIFLVARMAAVNSIEFYIFLVASLYSSSVKSVDVPMYAHLTETWDKHNQLTSTRNPLSCEYKL